MQRLQTTSLRVTENQLFILDQQALPQEKRWLDASTVEALVGHIHALRVRGAPLIGLSASLLLALLAVVAVVSIWTPLGWQFVADRWFSLPNFFYFLPVPILVAVCGVLIWRLTRNPHSHARPFLLTLGLIFLGFSGLGISLWPNIIPPGITIWDAAAPPSSQLFMLVGTLLIIPLILVYTAWSYYVFRGKVTDTEGYH